MEDAGNRGRLAKLLRFHTTASPDTLTSLDEYVARMKPGQKSIYFICGGSKEEVAGSPFLEQLRAQGYEAILFTEPMDEYMMQVRCACAGTLFGRAALAVAVFEGFALRCAPE